MANSPHIGKVGAHSNQETRPCDSSSLGPAVAPVSQKPPTGRKRKFRTLSSEHHTLQSEKSNQSETQAKKQKHSSCTSSNSTKSSSTDSTSSSWDTAQRSYWDSLSRLWLTPDALRELNRRHSLLQTSAPPDTQMLVTRKQCPTDISQFARRGGPDLSEIRNVCCFLYSQKLIALTVTQHPNPEASSATTDSMPRSSKEKKRSSAYDANYEQHMGDTNVFMPSRSERAVNHEGWDQVVIRPRNSPSRSSERSFHSFTRAARDAQDESEVMSMVIPKLVGRSRHAHGENVKFGNLVRISDEVKTAQPDYYEGELPGEGNRHIRRLLDDTIVPSTHKERAFLPTYCAEVKGPGGTLVVATRQAMHDGALAARGMHGLQSLGGSDDYDGNAYAASAVYHGEGDLKLYTHHQTQPRGRGTLPHTHMNRIFAGTLVHNPRNFREARNAFRNVGDEAHEHRVRFIEDANRRLEIVTPEPPTRASRSPRPQRRSARTSMVRKPLACQTAAFDSSDGHADNSSDDEDSDDGDRSRPVGRRSKPLTPKPEIKTIAPKRPATSPSAGRRSTLRRRTRASVYLDPESSDEESSRGRRAPNILLASPGRPATRSPSISRRRLSIER